MTGRRGRAAPRPAIQPIAALRADPMFFVAQLIVFAKIALLLVLFDPSAADAFALPKSSASHATTLLLVAAMSYLVLRHPEAMLRFSWAHMAALSVLALFALATPFAISSTVGVFGAPRRYLGLAQMADNLVLYAAGAALFPAVRDLGRLLLATATATVPVAAYAIVQRAGFDPVTYGVSTVARSSTTMGQPDVAGGYLSIAAVSFVAALIFVRARLHPLWQLSLALVAGATVVALYDTGTRAGLLGLAGGLVALFAIAYVSAALPRHWLAAGAVAAGVLAIGIIGATSLGSRLRPDVLANDHSVLARVEIWDTALRAVSQRPILGLGPDNFVAAYPGLRSERSYFLAPGVLENSTHDWFLYALTSAGPLAALAFVTVIAVALATGLRASRLRDPRGLLIVPLLAYLGQGLVNVNDVALDSVLWLTLGCLVSAVGVPIDLRTKAASHSAAAVLAGAVSIAAIFGLSHARERVVASQFFGREEQLSNAAQGLLAVEAARQALAIDPQRAEYWSGFGRALFVAGNAGAAAQAFKEAADREPWQPSYWRNVGLASASAGDTRGALDALRRAVGADPYDADSYGVLARISYNTGDYPQALADGRISVRLRPEIVAEYDAPLRAALALNKLQDAADLLESGVARTNSNTLRDELAQVYDGLGRRDLALALVRQSLAIDPGDEVALLLLDKYTKP